MWCVLLDYGRSNLECRLFLSIVMTHIIQLDDFNRFQVTLGDVCPLEVWIIYVSESVTWDSLDARLRQHWDSSCSN